MHLPRGVPGGLQPRTEESNKRHQRVLRVDYDRLLRRAGTEGSALPAQSMVLHLPRPLRLRPDCHPTDEGGGERRGGRVHEHVRCTAQAGGLRAQDEEGESPTGTGRHIHSVQRRLPDNDRVMDGVDGVHRGVEHSGDVEHC
jgi:hypothetical protein